MVNKLHHSIKTGASKFLKSAILTGGMLLFVLKPGVSKGNTELKSELTQILKKVPAKERKIQETEKTEKTAKFETMPTDTTDALTFATKNVDKYYPDMKDHLNTMINSFRDKEHKDSTLALLNKMVQNISDSSQKTGSVIYALESVFRKDQSFSLKYDSKITDETFKYVEQFDTDYKAWFDRYYDRLLIAVEKLEKNLKKNKQELEKNKQELEKNKQELEKNKQELEKNKQELEKNMSKFSLEDIKGNPSLKQLFITTETFYKENNFQIPTNIQKFFDAIK